ncbi:TetR/AcrR family transcriptional regulator [Hydrogenophaga sp.]|uniref:TetR/AcrR family transcriptional regulator n=1 Tax=Hydrogenophaga sp. TaxID=1904254 RepID=UPI002721EF42|nr:TetR family transcriptional regulator [Hydrogenophaga sp.]MDO9435993.1 TetR family transcriptional regulator [Hydrogenophaga sp.]
MSIRSDTSTVIRSDQDWSSVQPIRQRTIAEMTREKIVLVAASIFGEKGFVEATTRDIAAAAGIKAGSMYYHFKSKDEILDEILSESVQLLKSALEEALSVMPLGVTYSEQLKTAIEVHLNTLYARTPRAVFYRVYASIPPAMRKRNLAQRREYGRIWLRIIRGGVASGEFKPTLDERLQVLLLLGVLADTMNWYRLELFSVEVLARAIFEREIAGIGKAQG